MPELRSLEEVARAWMRILTVVFLGGVCSACAGGAGSTFTSPGVGDRTVGEVSIIDWSDCTGMAIGITCTLSLSRDMAAGTEEVVPRNREYARAILEPGVYHTEAYYVAIATWGTWSKEDQFILQISEDIDYKPGQEYLVNVDHWNSDQIAWGSSWWIENSRTGELVAGGRPPKHLPGFSSGIFD